MIDFAVVLLQNPAQRDEPKKAFAFLQSRGTIDINEIAEHMVSHGCAYDKADIVAIITKMVGCSKELLMDGYRLNLGDLGHLYLSCSSEGAVSKEAFRRANIKKISVNFKPGNTFSDINEKASLHRVPTRRAAQAALDAEIANLTTADWSESGSEVTIGDDVEP